MPWKIGSGARSTTYERKDEDIDDLENLATKLTDDLHSQLHLIGSEPVLSKEWCAMSDLCGRIAHVTEVEARLDKDKSGSVTIWEGEELALRYLMEDGKLTVCLRNLVEFRVYIRERCLLLKSESKEGDEDSRMLDNFEKGMGVLLRNAWQHVEAVQTTDLPLLVEYCGTVLSEAVSDLAWGRPRVELAFAASDLHQRQESLVVHYLNGVCTCIEDIQPLGFMNLVKNHNIVERLVDFLCVHASRLGNGDLLAAAQALSNIVDSEDFLTYEDSHASSETRSAIANLSPLFLDSLTQDYDTRRSVQPLLRYIQVCC